MWLGDAGLPSGLSPRLFDAVALTRRREMPDDRADSSLLAISSGFRLMERTDSRRVKTVLHVNGAVEALTLVLLD